MVLVLSSVRLLQIWGSGLTGLEALGVMLTRLTIVYRAGGVYLTPWLIAGLWFDPQILTLEVNR